MNKVVVDWSRTEQEAIAGALADSEKPIWMDSATYALVPGNGGLYPERAAEVYRVLTEIDDATLRPDVAAAFDDAMAQMRRDLTRQSVSVTVAE